MKIYKVKQDYETANAYETADPLQLSIDLVDYLWENFENDIPNHEYIFKSLESLKIGESVFFKDITITAVTM